MLTSSAAIFLSFRDRVSKMMKTFFVRPTIGEKRRRSKIERIVRSVVMIVHKYLFIYELARVFLKKKISDRRRSKEGRDAGHTTLKRC